MRKSCLIEQLETRQHLADFALAVNFQPLDAAKPARMAIDYGAVYAARRGGLTFGWSEDRAQQAVDRNVTPVQRNDTFIHMNGATWEIAVPSGDYKVYVVAGDPAKSGHRVGIEVEGSIAIAAVTKPRRMYLEGWAPVHVGDGKLSIRSLAPGSDLISYIAIEGTFDKAEPPVGPPIVTQPLGTLAWSSRQSLTVPRVEGMSAAVGDKLYVFGGYLDSTWAPTARVDRFDPATNTWKRMGDMPERISHCGTATDGRYVYFAGGYQGLSGNKQNFASTTTRRYDPINDTWTTLKPLPQARGGGEMFHVSGKLFYVAGSDAKRLDHNDVWMLDLTQSNADWVARASLPEARNHFGGGVIGGKIYVVAGQTGQEEWVSFKNDVWAYDPATDKWTARAPLPNPLRSHQTASTFVHNGYILTLGGETDGSIPGKPLALRNVNAYDPVKNVWTTLTPLPAARSTGFANSVGNTIVYSAGYSGATFYTTTWVGIFS